MERISLCGLPAAFERYDAVVIGSGCAGFNAADSLRQLGVESVCVVTEGRNMGTSRNTGSDKQTYYKLSLCGDAPDSVREMARDLAAGGGVDGPVALAEAAGSVRGFLKLVQLGVGFPTNELGEYAGYKTDHDPRQRATSCGPLTSRRMTEALEKAVDAKGIPVLDGLTAFAVLKDGDRACGVLCCDRLGAFRVLAARAVVLATGGPADLYENSVYPESQTGMTGMALRAGAAGANLSEWQYGLASVKFRWNVSGSYQQALPRYVAVGPDGTEREFLPEYLGSAAAALDLVFLKGYQWPFDAAKVCASSLVDVLVHHEIFRRGSRVYLDYTREPAGLERGFEGLSSEAREYLENCGAAPGLPIDRLRQINPGAIDLYASHGIDLEREMLEISVCAQHMNGGLRVDEDWKTTVPGLWCAGEAAGTFGVTRPGGSALNSTQVGSYRAARSIALTLKDAAESTDEAVRSAAESEMRSVLPLLEGGEDPETVRRQVRREMSRCAAHVRDPEAMEALRKACSDALRGFGKTYGAEGPKLPAALKTRDMLLTATAVLEAMETAAERCGSRGGALVRGSGGALRPGTPEGYDYAPETPGTRSEVLVTEKTEDGFRSRFVPARPIPDPDLWFETVWRAFRERGGI